VGIHCIDALCYVLNQPAGAITAVTTLAHRDADSGQVESHAVLALEYTSGCMASVTVTTRAAYRSLIEVTGATGVLTCENSMTIDNPVHLVHYRKGQPVLDELISNADAFAEMLDGFAAAATAPADRAERNSFLAPGREGLANQRVLDAAYQSWSQGRRIDLVHATPNAIGYSPR
jgi:1,5-anhydro-D-fructose reductase (1,5-anhydro-D-mannitol-forming)